MFQLALTPFVLACDPRHRNKYMILTGVLSCCFSLFTTYKSRKGVVYLSSLASTNPLASMPPEVIREIADKLPSESVVALSLACKQLRSILERRFSNLRQNPNALNQFLKLLQRDISARPNKPYRDILCERCHKVYLCWIPYPNRHPVYVVCLHKEIPLSYWAPHPLDLDFNTSRRIPEIRPRRRALLQSLNRGRLS